MPFIFYGRPASAIWFAGDFLKVEKEKRAAETSRRRLPQNFEVTWQRVASWHACEGGRGTDKKKVMHVLFILFMRDACSTGVRVWLLS